MKKAFDPDETKMEMNESHVILVSNSSYYLAFYSLGLVLKPWNNSIGLACFSLSFGDLCPLTTYRLPPASNPARLFLNWELREFRRATGARLQGKNCPPVSRRATGARLSKTSHPPVVFRKITVSPAAACFPPAPACRSFGLVLLGRILLFLLFRLGFWDCYKYSQALILRGRLVYCYWKLLECFSIQLVSSWWRLLFGFPSFLSIQDLLVLGSIQEEEKPTSLFS